MLSARWVKPLSFQSQPTRQITRQFSSCRVNQSSHTFLTRTKPLHRPQLSHISQVPLVSISIDSARYNSSWNPFNWGSNSVTKSTSQPSSSTTTNSEQTITNGAAQPIKGDESAQVLSSFKGEQDDVFEMLSNLAPAPAEPHWGFLKEAGLDFGWGPTSTMQWVFESIHIGLAEYTGPIPWWGSILILVTGLRVVLYPLSKIQSDQSARMQAIGPALQSLQTPVQSTDKAVIQNEMLEKRKVMSEIQQAAGVNYLKMFGGTILQMALGIGLFRFISNLAQTPGLGLTSGGALWFPDLTAADPLYILPIFMGATAYGMMRVGLSGQTPSKLQNYMIIGLPVVAIVATSFQASAVQLSFAVGGLILAGQNTYLTIPSVRKRLGLYPRFKSNTNTIDSLKNVTMNSGLSKGKDSTNAGQQAAANFKAQKEREAARRAMRLAQASKDSNI